MLSEIDMSVNDKVEVIWKTSCQWRDRSHWPKRKDIKPLEDDTGASVSLKPGDAVKVKFGLRWYDAEVKESWIPRAKKGMYYVSLPFDELSINIIDQLFH